MARFVYSDGYYCDIAMQLLSEYPNLCCEFGAQFRFGGDKLLSGKAEPWLLDHMDRWRTTCTEFPQRVIWGQDLFRWKDLEPLNYSDGIRVWEEISKDFAPDTRQAIAEDNILRLTGATQAGYRQAWNQ